MQKLFKSVESLFETPPHLNLKYNPNVQLESHFELIRNIAFFNDNEEHFWKIIAGRLSPFFDAVARIEDQRVHEVHFQNQAVSHPIWITKIKWPESTLFTPLRTDARALSKKLFGEALFDSKRFTAFVIYLGNKQKTENRLVLFTSTAEPWLTIKMENLMLAFERIDSNS